MTSAHTSSSNVDSGTDDLLDSAISMGYALVSGHESVFGSTSGYSILPVAHPTYTAPPLSGHVPPQSFVPPAVPFPGFTFPPPNVAVSSVPPPPFANFGIPPPPLSSADVTAFRTAGRTVIQAPHVISVGLTPTAQSSPACITAPFEGNPAVRRNPVTPTTVKSKSFTVSISLSKPKIERKNLANIIDDDQLSSPCLNADVKTVASLSPLASSQGDRKNACLLNPATVKKAVVDRKAKERVSDSVSEDSSSDRRTSAVTPSPGRRRASAKSEPKLEDEAGRKASPSFDRQGETTKQVLPAKSKKNSVSPAVFFRGVPPEKIAADLKAALEKMADQFNDLVDSMRCQMMLQESLGKLPKRLSTLAQGADALADIPPDGPSDEFDMNDVECEPGLKGLFAPLLNTRIRKFSLTQLRKMADKGFAFLREVHFYKPVAKASDLPPSSPALKVEILEGPQPPKVLWGGAFEKLAEMLDRVVERHEREADEAIKRCNVAGSSDKQLLLKVYTLVKDSISLCRNSMIETMARVANSNAWTPKNGKEVRKLWKAVSENIYSSLPLQNFFLAVPNAKAKVVADSHVSKVIDALQLIIDEKLLPVLFPSGVDLFPAVSVPPPPVPRTTLPTIFAIGPQRQLPVPQSLDLDSIPSIPPFPSPVYPALAPAYPSAQPFLSPCRPAVIDITLIDGDNYLETCKGTINKLINSVCAALAAGKERRSRWEECRNSVETDCKATVQSLVQKVSDALDCGDSDDDGIEILDEKIVRLRSTSGSSSDSYANSVCLESEMRDTRAYKRKCSPNDTGDNDTGPTKVAKIIIPDDAGLVVDLSNVTRKAHVPSTPVRIMDIINRGTGTGPSDANEPSVFKSTLVSPVRIVDRIGSEDRDSSSKPSLSRSPSFSEDLGSVGGDGSSFFRDFAEPLRRSPRSRSRSQSTDGKLTPSLTVQGKDEFAVPLRVIMGREDEDAKEERRLEEKRRLNDPVYTRLSQKRRELSKLKDKSAVRSDSIFREIQKLLSIDGKMTVFRMEHLVKNYNAVAGSTSTMRSKCEKLQARLKVLVRLKSKLDMQLEEKKLAVERMRPRLLQVEEQMSEQLGRRRAILSELVSYGSCRIRNHDLVVMGEVASSLCGHIEKLRVHVSLRETLGPLGSDVLPLPPGMTSQLSSDSGFAPSKKINVMARLYVTEIQNTLRRLLGMTELESDHSMTAAEQKSEVEGLLRRFSEECRKHLADRERVRELLPQIEGVLNDRESKIRDLETRLRCGDSVYSLRRH